MREDKIMRKLDTNAKSGTEYKKIAKLLKSAGLRVRVAKMNVEQLRSFLDRQIPVVLAIQAWADDPKEYNTSIENGHYLVAIGYDDEKIFFEDPAVLGHKTYLSFDELESRWVDSESKQVLLHFGIAVYGKAPKFKPDLAIKVGGVSARRLDKFYKKLRVNHLKWISQARFRWAQDPDTVPPSLPSFIGKPRPVVFRRLDTKKNTKAGSAEAILRIAQKELPAFQNQHDSDLKLSTLVVNGHDGKELHFETGKPVTFPFLRNTEKSPYLGTRFGQDVEPAGRYLLLHEEDDSSPAPDATDGRMKWETGTVTFHNPIVLEWTGYGSDGWKARLSRAFGNKRRKKLSEALVSHGYDGIVTLSEGSKGQKYVGEIVDLTMFKGTEKTAALTEAKNKAEQMGVEPTDTVEFLRKRVNDPFTFIHFSDSEKLGVNPSYRWHTPLGVHAHPLDDKAIAHLANKDTGVYDDHLLFGIGRKYVHVFQVPEGAQKNLLLSSKYGYDDLRNDIAKLRKSDITSVLGEEVSWPEDHEIHEYSYHESALANLFSILKTVLGRYTGGKKRFPEATHRITRVLRTVLGYSGVVDDNCTGAIALDIPCQAVFFNPRIYEHKRAILNNPVYLRRARNLRDTGFGTHREIPFAGINFLNPIRYEDRLIKKAIRYSMPFVRKIRESGAAVEVEDVVWINTEANVGISGARYKPDIEMTKLVEPKGKVVTIGERRKDGKIPVALLLEMPLPKERDETKVKDAAVAATTKTAANERLLQDAAISVLFWYDKSGYPRAICGKPLHETLAYQALQEGKLVPGDRVIGFRIIVQEKWNFRTEGTLIWGAPVESLRPDDLVGFVKLPTAISPLERQVIVQAVRKEYSGYKALSAWIDDSLWVAVLLVEDNDERPIRHYKQAWSNVTRFKFKSQGGPVIASVKSLKTAANERLLQPTDIAVLFWYNSAGRPEVLVGKGLHLHLANDHIERFKVGDKILSIRGVVSSWGEDEYTNETYEYWDGHGYDLIHANGLPAESLRKGDLYLLLWLPEAPPAIVQLIVQGVRRTYSGFKSIFVTHNQDVGVSQYKVVDKNGRALVVDDYDRSPSESIDLFRKGSAKAQKKVARNERLIQHADLAILFWYDKEGRPRAIAGNRLHNDIANEHRRSLTPGSVVYGLRASVIPANDSYSGIQELLSIYPDALDQILVLLTMLLGYITDERYKVSEVLDPLRLLDVQCMLVV